MKAHYGMLGLNLGLSAVVMYLVMFTMIDASADFYNNVNSVYMTLMMVSPMAILMLLTMGSMYSNQALNLALYAGFAAIFLLSLWAMRTQALVVDAQFLRSMIPHHSGALLMCRESSISDPEIVDLCQQIERSQKAEIVQMKGFSPAYRRRGGNNFELGWAALTKERDNERDFQISFGLGDARRRLRLRAGR